MYNKNNLKITKQLLLTLTFSLVTLTVLAQASIDKDEFPNCELPVDFEEPEADKKIQKWLKRVDAQVKDLKAHASVDNDCSVEDIKVIRISEQKGNGNYVLCVNGKEMRYRRTGSVFHRQGVSPVGNY